MNKIIGIVLAIVLIAGGVWYFTQGQSETKNDTSSTQTESEVKAENTSLKALMAAGNDTKCTYRASEEGSDSSGTIYVSKNKGRGDFEVTEEGKVNKGHMIFDNSTSYIWMDGETTGIKIVHDQSDTTDDSTTTGVDPDKNYDYECGSWKADDSFFVPPSDIIFQELAIPQIPTSTMPNSMDKSTICNSLPEPARSQCLSSM